MTTTTTTSSELDALRGSMAPAGARRLATAAGLVLGGIRSRWNAFVEAGQLGPDTERSISRHLGGRI